MWRASFSCQTAAHITKRPLCHFFPSFVSHRSYPKPQITPTIPSTVSRPFTTSSITTMRATARIANTVIAEADEYETVEGNVYFPPSSIKDKSMLESSSLTTKCPWKGTASYYTLKVDGQTYKDAAWYYPEPKDKAKNIKDHVAFCKFPVDKKGSRRKGGECMDANECVRQTRRRLMFRLAEKTRKG